MKNENTADTQGVSTRHWMDKYGIKFEERLTVTKAQLELKMRPCFPLKTRSWSYMMLHTAGYQGEHAVTMKGNQRVPLQPADIADALHKAAIKYYREAGVLLSKEELAALKPNKNEIRRVLAEMEEEGICERRYNNVPLRTMPLKDRQSRLNGKIDLFVWLRPRKANPDLVKQEYQETMVRCATAPLPEFSMQQIINHFKKESERLSLFLRHLDADKQKTVSDAWEQFLQVVNNIVPEVVATAIPQVGTTAPPYIREEIEEEILEKETPPASQHPGIETGRAGGFPLFEMAIRKHFPATSDSLIAELLRRAREAHTLPGELTDAILVQAVEEAHFAGQKTAHGFKTTIPRVIKSWVEEISHEQKSA